MNSVENHFAKYSHIESQLMIDGCEPDVQPDLSVMIPTFRRPHLLKEAIESVVNQSAHGINIEIVIIDNDAETDSLELATLVESFFPSNIRLFRNKENIGMFGNWNRCIELARAPKLTILNDDDLLNPDFIKKTHHLAGQAAISVGCTQFKEKVHLQWPINNINKTNLLTVADFFLGNPIPGSLGFLMIKKQAVELGGYNSELWPTSDYDFSYRYYQSFGIKKMSSKLAAYRWLENESLKTKTLEGFLENDIIFRNNIIFNNVDLKLKSILLSFLSELMVISNSIGYNKVNNKFDIYKNVGRNKIYFSGFYIYLFKFRSVNKVFRYVLNFSVKFIL
ncbi:glycosyltransferase family 2 protein [Shewanella baltica]|uniref:glycosyltransferase family 2 protein n=1 Tax=Shewanella baltica TaxID=62322 RepID=UPI00217EC6CE|nr:glycosyltransferase family 2 protein [Shewanella baltica]MCS6136732.1 glycosyltransferase family 2 protein [Shewanella baltica]